MNYENNLKVDDVERTLIEWAEDNEIGEECPHCLLNWSFDEDQLDAIREACVVPHAAASIANAMCCITDEEGVAAIAEALRPH